MLGAIVRGVSMIAMLTLFMWTHDRFLLLACALCAGAVLGHELYWGQWMGILIFALVVPFFFGTFSLQGAIMTSSFFSINVGILQGLFSFLMLAAIAAYFVWEVERTMDLAEEERADARQ